MAIIVIINESNPIGGRTSNTMDFHEGPYNRFAHARIVDVFPVPTQIQSNRYLKRKTESKMAMYGLPGGP
jgi:hypothetical protein